MDASSLVPAVRSASIAVASLKCRQNNPSGSFKCNAFPRNVNANVGSSVAETLTLPSPSRSNFPSRLKHFWFVKVGREKETEESNISLLKGRLDLNLTESLEANCDIHGDPMEKSQIECSEKCAQSTIENPNDKKFSHKDLKQRNSDDESNENEAESEGSCPGGDSRERGNWVVRILEMRSFWRDRDKSTSAAVMEPLKNKASYSSRESGCKEHGDCCCESCYTDDSSLSSPMLEVPRADSVKHDRNSFSRFLHRVSLSEIKFFAQLSYLCNLAYTIQDIKPGDLLKNHRLRFITSSLEKKAESVNKAKELAANDKSFATSSGKNNSHSSEANTKRRLTVNPAVAYEIAAAAASYLHSQTKHLLPFKPTHKVEPDVDEQMNETKEAGEPDQSSELLKSKADARCEEVARMPLDASSRCEYKIALMNSSAQNEITNEISSLSKSEVASYIATSSMTAVVAAEEETKQAVANDLQSIHSSPCEWFICDEESTNTRLFVIQGSDSLASWQANLFFEPIHFEGLEVLVHRGIYEAAKGIYEQMLPEVYAHLKTYGDDARFRFTGHSLGGSLSVLVNLMLLIRGVLPLSSLLPVITFGSPCIMCGGDYLLKKLGLSISHIQSMMMHRDIVPRAFSCHYPDHVAEILKRLSANFRNHPCLDNLGLLYAPMGQLLILQPDDKVSPAHPLLPSGCALYVLCHILNNESDSEPSRAVQVRAAQIAFLNSPHPLETLSDPVAYGFDGSILRDHDSRNYLKTLKNVLRQEVKHHRRLLREQRRQMWWPLVLAESSMLIQRNSKVRNTMDSSQTFVGAVSTIDSISCTRTPRQFGFSLRVGIIFRRSKDTLKRFARLIASQHMQMGVLCLLSARMLIVEMCTKI